MNNFLVYKSSAGSGKTYTLIRVYLEIVLRDPTRFKNILAITFTNKAANEIKQRILSNLRMLSTFDEGCIPVKQAPLIESLLKSLDTDFKGLKQRAARVLTLILHNYADFAVSTIDSFMHRIIRSFSFDLKLSMNFDVEMDTDMLLAETVTATLAGVGIEDHVTDVLVKFVQERAESDESWQIERDLQNFSKNLFNEDAIALLPLSGEFPAEKLSSISSVLNKKITDFENRVRQKSAAAIQLIQRHGIDPESFYYGKSGIYNYFRKLHEGNFSVGSEPNSYVIKTISNNEWLSAKGKKSADGAAILSLSSELTEIFNQIAELFNKDEGEVILCRNILGNLYPMAVLGELNLRLSEVKRERNIVPVSEFNHIISSIVSNEPVPFIYERTGEKFRHYLIDEFQDTSVLQWHNLLPLVENSLSQGGKNMIVGDGKQAIYRFRNGEVEQFVKLPEVNNPDENPVISQRSEVLKREYASFRLDSNFRSKCEVVDFNNSFFSFASTRFLPDFNQVYQDSDQKSNPENRGGQVSIEFFDETTPDFSDFNCTRVLQLITELTETGYKPGDITVLCRSNKNSSEIASFLNKNEVKVVSSDSLLISKSAEVNFIINFLKMLADPGNSINIIAAAAYLSTENELKGLHDYFESSLNLTGFFETLQREGYDISLFGLRGLSLYDTCEELIRVFGLHLKSPVYIQFFLDEVLKYSSGKHSEINGFLEYWDQYRSKISVVMSQSDDSVQVMTIHKSKGLEFPVVIYAFADDSVKKLTRGSTWVELNDPGLPDLKAAMISINKSLQKTIFADIYNLEYAKSKLDLLNLIYVAFTRAAERLYILTGKPVEPKDEIKSVTALLRQFLVEKGLFRDNLLSYVFGSGSAKVNSKSLSKAEIDFENLFISQNWRKRLIFAGRAPVAWQASGPGKVQAAGNLMHQALSMIATFKDVPEACNKLIQQGLIIESEKPGLQDKLNQIVNHPDMRRFFDGSGVIAVETEILAPGGKSYRPDRVIFHKDHTDVVDYKAGRRFDSHISQIRHYAAMLEDMGYPGLRAWLVYIEPSVEVDLIAR